MTFTKVTSVFCGSEKDEEFSFVTATLFSEGLLSVPWLMTPSPLVELDAKTAPGYLEKIPQPTVLEPLRT